MKPCSYRTVSDDGRLVCAKIRRGEREVAPALCEACPAARIDCQHLRFSLEKRDQTAIVVRYGNGHTETWQSEPARVEFQRAACAALCLPLSGSDMCSGCFLYSPALSANTTPAAPEAIPDAVPGRIIDLATRRATWARRW